LQYDKAIASSFVTIDQELTMSDIKPPEIPRDILAQLQKPPLLKGESIQEYNDLLAGLIADVRPSDRIEWLWLMQFLDCIWEILRNRRYRAILIDLQRTQALRGVILKTVPSGYMEPRELRAAFEHWTDPGHFDQHGIPPESVPALALVQAGPSLDIIDKSLERLQRRCDSILQQLESRREVFTHRARRAAGKVLGAESTQMPCIASADATLAIGMADQKTPDQRGSVVPVQSSQAVAPSCEGASAEASAATPSSES
jgi:hypothetical protein